MFVKAFIMLGLAAMVLAKPQFPIYLKDGNVGVNFGGYYASAGLGGLLTGDNSAGGLHAEAGTPWGARASASLGGMPSGGQSAGCSDNAISRVFKLASGGKGWGSDD